MEPWRQGGAVGCGRRPAGEQLGTGVGSTRRRRPHPQPLPFPPASATSVFACHCRMVDPTSRMRIRPARDGHIAAVVDASNGSESWAAASAEEHPSSRSDEQSEEADEDGDGNAEAVGAAVLLFSPPPPAVAAATLLLFLSSDAAAAAGTRSNFFRTEDGNIGFRSKGEAEITAAAAPPRRIVSVPSSSLFKTVTVRCGHCSSLLTVNIGGLLLLPTSATAPPPPPPPPPPAATHFPHSLNLAPPANPPHHHSLLDEISTACSPTQLLLEQHGLGGLMASAASCRNNNVCRNNKKMIAFLRWALHPPSFFRARDSKKLVAFISGVPARIRARDDVVRMAVINFPCVHKKLRSKREERREEGREEGKKNMTWHHNMWDPRGFYANSTVTWDKTGVNTTLGSRVTGFV
uniref:glycylpeptide N-tetradecanoyltransferase n=1 Tax=Oryza glumipatula TaxID=40148 RepID=A0A0E0AFB7_9ORYZ